MIDASNHQFAGNKDYDVEGCIHIEDYFDTFLEQSGDYWKETYFELLKYENEFYYLKEFIVQTKLLALNEVVKQLEEEKGTQRIIDGIPNLVPNTLSPFEELLTKWIIADYVHTFEQGSIRSTETFYKTVKTIVERETKNFSVQIDFCKSPVELEFALQFVYGHWRLIEVSKRKESNQNTNDINKAQKQIEPIIWDADNVLLGYLIQWLKDNGFISKKTGRDSAIKNHFVDATSKQITSIKQGLNNVKKFNDGGLPKDFEKIEPLLNNLKNLKDLFEDNQ